MVSLFVRFIFNICIYDKYYNKVIFIKVKLKFIFFKLFIIENSFVLKWLILFKFLKDFVFINLCIIIFMSKI